MNKILVVGDILESIENNHNMEIEYIKKECLFAISEIKINIKENCSMLIDINLLEDTKLNFNVSICENVSADINILTHGKSGKIQYKYNLNENSTCNIFKFQNIDSIKEMIVINLNGINSNIEYNFKTIGINKETYDYHVFHNSSNTNSLIKNNGVCIENGTITYQVSSFVPKDIKNCIVSQNNRIINLTNNKCEIRPNLYIDSKEVEAFHSALIGKFSDEEMFYMQSRGLDKKMSENLLIRGFLTSDIKNSEMIKEVEDNIKMIWG